MWWEDIIPTERAWRSKEYVSHRGPFLRLCQLAAEMQCAVGQYSCSLLHCLWWEAILFYGGGSRALPLHPGQAHTGCANQKEQTCQLHLHTVKPQMLILSLNIQLCCAHGLLLPCSVRIWLLPNFVKHEFKTRSSFPKLLERSETEAAFPSHHCNAGIPHCHACAQRTCFSIISCSGSVTVSFHCSSGWYRWDCSHFCLFFIP